MERGEFVIITGRSGSGKTTLLNLVAGMTRPTSGQVLLEGAELWSLSDKEQSLLRNRKMGFIFQFPSLLPSLNAWRTWPCPPCSAPTARAPARSTAPLSCCDVGLADKLAAFPRQLSAGQQQRVVVARALINGPEMLLADEPTSDLDEQTEQEIMELLQKSTPNGRDHRDGDPHNPAGGLRHTSPADGKWCSARMKGGH